jgi:hypothetical protein
MPIRIYKGDELRGEYDEESHRIGTNDASLRRMVTEGVDGEIGGPGPKPGDSASGPAHFKPGDREFIFAFVDAVRRAGYRVEGARMNDRL